jgi:protoporphyrinogen oxidase
MKNTKPKKITILGAGIAGLSCGYNAIKQDYQICIYEKENTYGGLLDNIQIGDFLFDKAVHLSFASEPEVREIFDQTEYITHPPTSYSFENKIWFKHPIQNNLYPLPSNDKAELILSLFNRPDIEITNYSDWLRFQYGEAIAKRFFEQYTYKYWTISPEKMGTDWIGNRIRRADLSEILKGSYEDQNENHYYTKEMRYPVKGGYKAFLTPLIEMVENNVNYNKEIIEIDTQKKLLYFADNTQDSYEILISSLPLPVLCQSLDYCDPKILELSETLFATSIDLISVGFNKELKLDLWNYIYDSDIYASRMYSPSVKSKNNVPVGCSSLQFEIYSSIKSNKKHTKEELFENTKYALEKMQIADSEDILFMKHNRIDYGNVVFDLDMESRRDKIRNYLEAIGILTIGRFGEWDYLWSNQSFMSGLKILEKV